MSRPVIARRSIGLCLTALCSISPALGVADDSTFTSGTSLSSAGGQQIYAQICQGCHMPAGAGAVGAGHYPRLAGDPALVSWQYVALTVLNGKNGMPPFGLPADQVMETRAAHLSDAQVADVVNYVRSNFGNRYRNKTSAKEVAALPHPGKPPAP